MAFVNSKLTDDEVCRKFEITLDCPQFYAARRLSDNRLDRGISQWPELSCAHCGGEFIYTEGFDESDWGVGDGIVCNHCERVSYVEHIDYEGLYITICTVPPESE